MKITYPDSRAAFNLIMILIVCACLRVWLIGHTRVIARDGTIYVAMAQELGRDPSKVIRENDYPVGYPAAIAGMHGLMDAIHAAGAPESWDVAGQAVSLLANLAALAAVWMFAGLTFNWRVAWVTALLLGLGRNFAGLGADVLSDSLALCCQMWAVVFAVLATESLQSNRKCMLLWAAAAGVCGGLGYLVRPEAMLVVIVAAFVWAGRQFTHRRSWKLIISSTALMCFSAFLCALPYMIAIGDISKKKHLGRLLEKLVSAVDPNGGIIAMANPQLRGIGELLAELFESLHPMLGVAFCVWSVTWLVGRISKKSLPKEILLMPNYLGGWFLCGTAVFTLPILLGLYCSAGYISYRHVLLLAAVMAPFAGAGILILIEWLTIILTRFGVNARLRKAALYIAVAGLAVGLLVNSLRPLHNGKEAYRQAGLFAGELPVSGECCEIITNSSWAAHYIRQKNAAAKVNLLYYHDTEKVEIPYEMCSRSTVKYLVWANNSKAAEIRVAESAFQGNTEFKPIGKFYPKSGKERNTVSVYEIAHN